MMMGRASGAGGLEWWQMSWNANAHGTPLRYVPLVQRGASAARMGFFGENNYREGWTDKRATARLAQAVVVELQVDSRNDGLEGRGTGTQCGRNDYHRLFGRRRASRASRTT